jgi:hypothetical protein
MAESPNSSSWDSEGNLLIPRYGIRIALGLALLAAGAFCAFLLFAEKAVHTAAPEMRGSSLPNSLSETIAWVALALVPYLLSWFLLSRRSEEAIAAGAGVAAGLFLNSLLVSSVAFASLFVGFHPSYPALDFDLMAISSLALAACSVWVIVSGFRIANKAGWGIFFIALAATIIGMAAVYHSLGGR